ncbi:hypothetical protein GXW83_19100 [Streptacidiphilus sp. PB12-B1b]|uniref:hypothetical protein n=1 Tax=Streptacidiphilus sp. PB12-B1b TaxID=2705012 RepID=UPI0015FA00E3|nr:hypothetical protein [Streptacidiphilus sp. PB12-B1b]QMU77489.1 hypothetical protein GXW83_19100 [Streptacidiphilus sp. PB12-B1b]
MGASGWDYITPFDTDVATTLARLHEQLFQAEYAGDYATLRDLWQDEEFMGEEGTHSILDVCRVVTTTAPPKPSVSDDYSTIRPLAPERVLHHFGTERPSRRQYQQRCEAERSAGATTLADECRMRWTGLYLVLHEHDRPTDVAFWGCSGD